MKMIKMLPITAHKIIPYFVFGDGNTGMDIVIHYDPYTANYWHISNAN